MLAAFVFLVRVETQTGRLGGNGPDFQAWRAALDAQRIATLETRSELMEGHMFRSPPVHLPGLPERYRPAK